MPPPSQNLTAVGDGYQSVVWYTDHAGEDEGQGGLQVACLPPFTV